MVAANMELVLVAMVDIVNNCNILPSAFPVDRLYSTQKCCTRVKHFQEGWQG